MMSAPLTPELRLDQLLARISQMAEDCQLLQVPAMPVSPRPLGWVVVLGIDDLTAEDFIKLAAAAGARILYVRAEPFDADTYLDLEFFDDDSFVGAVGWSSGGELARIREQSQHFNGRIGAVELGFAMNGVLHRWTATEEWHHQFTAMVGQVPEVERGGGFTLRDWTAQEQTAADRVADELSDLASFRAASYTGRGGVAREEHPQIAAWEGDPRLQPLAQATVFKAGYRVQEQAERAHRAMEENLPELAAQFAATAAWQNAGSARARREHARDFLTAQAGGYPATTRLLELFLDTQPLQRKRTR